MAGKKAWLWPMSTISYTTVFGAIEPASVEVRPQSFRFGIKKGNSIPMQTCSDCIAENLERYNSFRLAQFVRGKGADYELGTYIGSTHEDSRSDLAVRDRHRVRAESARGFATINHEAGNDFDGSHQ